MHTAVAGFLVGTYLAIQHTLKPAALVPMYPAGMLGAPTAVSVAPGADKLTVSFTADALLLDTDTFAYKISALGATTVAVGDANGYLVPRWVGREFHAVPRLTISREAHNFGNTHIRLLLPRPSVCTERASQRTLPQPVKSPSPLHWALSGSSRLLPAGKRCVFAAEKAVVESAFESGVHDLRCNAMCDLGGLW